MARILDQTRWVANRSGWLTPGLDQGATGNNTALGPTPYIIDGYTVPANKKASIKSIGYLAAISDVTLPHVVGANNAGVIGLIRTGTPDYLVVVRSQGVGLPNGAGWADMSNQWESANQLPVALDGISFTSSDTLQVICSPANAIKTQWTVCMWGKLNGTRAYVCQTSNTYTTTANQILWQYTPTGGDTFTLYGIKMEGHVTGAVAGLMQCHHDGQLLMDFGRVGMESGCCEPMGGDRGGGIFLPLWNMDFYPGDNFSLGVESWTNDGTTVWQQLVFADETNLTDYPAEGDVEDGVSFGFGTLTGTFVVPAEADVKNGTNYGAGGTEFTGTLVGGGGGTTVSGISGDRAQGVSTPVTL